ncbi:MAG: hypothetical protein MJA31_00475 [Clostridia bacterium]|nr:hypothetical protein [Clostridia bacterium]
MRHWIYPANPKLYDVIGAFTKEDQVVWPMTSKVDIDDIVYIYCGAPHKQICFKCQVADMNIPTEFAMKQADHYIKEKKGQAPKRNFMLLKVLVEYDLSSASPLSFGTLKANGLKGSIMGPQCLENNPKLLEFIKDFN